jgi:hypothetical protein
MRRLQQDFATRGMGFSDRFAELGVAPEIDQAVRRGPRGHLANVVGVCHNLSVALAGSSP